MKCIYKVKNNLSPPFMCDIFYHKENSTTTRMGDTFYRPNVNKVYMGEHSLRNFGPIVWNTMLPEKFKTCSSLAEFKNSIKSWIPSDCPCRLCKNYVGCLGFVNLFE